MVSINYLAVVLAAAASMIIGFLWYGPVFGKIWTAEMGITTYSVAEAKKKGIGKSYALMFVGSFITATVLSYFISYGLAYTKMGAMHGGLSAGFWSWFGFIAPVTLGTVLWENKSWKLWFLNNGYYLITLCIMGIILAAW